ncbi:MAG TPA: hypothetical protein VLW06_09390 [Terriglobales bacterium]|nr:hypothetical protein [Terriglobales bacterium]
MKTSYRSTITLLICWGILFLPWMPFASAQEQPPSGFEQWTPDSLKHFDQKMHADAVQDPHHFAVEQLADYPHENFLLVHRESDGQVEWHETQVDVFFVLSGSATLLLGGTMSGAETVGPHEKRNGTITGGVRRKLSAGDVVRIPPRVPHQILLGDSHEFNYFVVKIKGY